MPMHMPKATLTYSMREIESAVATRFQLHPWELRSRDHTRRVSHPRHIAMFLCREYGTKPFPLIGRYFDRDHTTVMFGQRRIARLLEADPGVAAQVNGVREILAQRPSWRATRVTELSSPLPAD